MLLASLSPWILHVSLRIGLSTATRKAAETIAGTVPNTQVNAWSAAPPTTRTLPAHERERPVQGLGSLLFQKCSVVFRLCILYLILNIISDAILSRIAFLVPLLNRSSRKSRNEVALTCWPHIPQPRRTCSVASGCGSKAHGALRAGSRQRRGAIFPGRMLFIYLFYPNAPPRTRGTISNRSDKRRRPHLVPSRRASVFLDEVLRQLRPCHAGLSCLSESRFVEYFFF